MRKLFMAIATLAAMVTSASAQETIPVGVIFGFTGPVESLTPPMAASVELAVTEVMNSKLLLNGATVATVRADSTCVDSAAATTAAERLVTADKVKGIIGGDCSGVTGAILQSVARPHGMVMISPSATSPSLSTTEDDGLFFRTAPSDARGSEILSGILMKRGIKGVALTYTNNDYGKGFANAFATAFEARGGNITVSLAHEDGRADYSAEVGTLAAAGGTALVVAGYVDQGGLGIIRSALDTGAFDLFVLGSGMIGDSLIENLGADLEGSFGQLPGSDTPGAARMKELGEANNLNGSAPYAAESYDAAALLMLAMQAAGSSNPALYKEKIMTVANAPGEKIYPGELAKGLGILKDGGEVDYVGGSAVELIGSGESAGNYREVEISNGEFVTVHYW